MSQGETGTLSWHAAKVEGEPGVYRIFDTFNDEVAREAHLNGEAAQELTANVEKLFYVAPKDYRPQLVAENKALARVVVRQMPSVRDSRQAIGSISVLGRRLPIVRQAFVRVA